MTQKNKRALLLALLGVVVGYAYYEIGYVKTDSSSLRHSMWLPMLFFGAVGWVIGGELGKKKNRVAEETKQQTQEESESVSQEEIHG